MKPPHVVSCPFVGLVPYTEDDAPFFFGRERDQQRILANLFASRLTILYGASGVGKSSVLRAGIIQEVQRRIDRARSAGEKPEIAVVYYKEWKGDILASLRASISAALLAQLGHDLTADLDANLDLETLLVHVGTCFKGDLLLILDQFEEYFLYHPITVPDVFAHQFANATNHSGLSAHFLISLRDDAVSQLDRFKALIPNLFSNYLRLQHLLGRDARYAILMAIRRYNKLPNACKEFSETFHIERGLAEIVIDQVRTGRVRVGQAGQGTLDTAAATFAVETPYLQLVMTRLWNEEREAGSAILRCKTLSQLGGAEKIVKGHLEAALGGLSARERDMCALIFPHLVTPSGTKIAHTVLNLARFAKVEDVELKPLLDRLAASDKRILAPVAPPDGEPGQLQFEIYHDSLAEAVLSWQARYEAERERALRAHERRRLLKIAVALGIAFVIAAGAAAVAIWQYHAAQNEKAAALAYKAESDKQRIAKELAEAEKGQNKELIAQLRKQYQRADADVKASKGTGQTLAAVLAERDKLRSDINALQSQINGTPKGDGKVPVQQSVVEKPQKNELLKPQDAQPQRVGQTIGAKSAEGISAAKSGINAPSAEASLVPEKREEPPKPAPHRRKDGLLYVWIPPGTFTMGCSSGDNDCDIDEKPAHEVTIANGFWMGQTAVTLAAYQLVIGQISSASKEPNLPVSSINWHDANEYCEAIDMRLPTEAEWEYAARAGSTASRYGDVDQIAWYRGNSGNQTHEVAKKLPNAFNLYDMLGNVWQWTADWYDKRYYEQSVDIDPPGPPRRVQRVLRGGSCRSKPNVVRVSDRFQTHPDHRVNGFGFRCVAN